jgi:glycosyltransferase involved in cell wall biosynthesis
MIGSVGVPARYGGFETLAEQLARGIRPETVRFVVYCERASYPEAKSAEGFAGHETVFLPVRANGASSMIYDALGMVHALLLRSTQAILLLGCSGAWALPFVRLLRSDVRIVTNIDGLEWRRDKFGRFARSILRVLEWFACRCSHVVIADNTALVPIVRDLYGVEPVVVAYGGDHTIVGSVSLCPTADYLLSIARIEPENKCHLILEGCARARAPLVFVGNWSASAYGRELKARYSGVEGFALRDPIYDVTRLAALRRGAVGYIHGHSVGGTNPSLVEALFHSDRIFAFDCGFNRATLDDAGAYFVNADALARLISDSGAGRIELQRLEELRNRYVWRRISDEYVRLLLG